MQIKNVNVEEAFKNLKNDNKSILIDVREDDEYRSGHAEGAISLPLSTINESSTNKLKDYNNIYVMCRSGGRSMMATEILNSLNLPAINVEGGIMAWKSKSLPVV